MLLRCNRDCTCKQCLCNMPHFLTLTYSGFEYGHRTTNQLIVIQPCFDAKGYHAYSVPGIDGPFGSVRAPGGCESERGPITDIALEYEGRGGYRRPGRTPPNVTIDGGSGKDATFTATFAETNEGQYYEGIRELPSQCDTCQACLKAWYIDGVDIGGNGIGYRDGDLLDLTVEDDTLFVDNSLGRKPSSELLSQISLVLRVDKNEPEVEVSGADGSGAELVVELTDTGDGWTVASIDVEDGGGGYRDQGAVTVTGATEADVTHTPCVARALTELTQPRMGVVVRSFSGGGATFNVTLSGATRRNGRPGWRVTGISITNGGSGYAAGDEVAIITSDSAERWSGSQFSNATPWTFPFSQLSYVTAVNGSGAITAVSFTPNSQLYYWQDTGVIESVAIDNGGEYYRSVPSHVEVTHEGWTDQYPSTKRTPFYREGEDAEGCVSDFRIYPDRGFEEFFSGSGAIISANVDGDGELTGLNLEDGGDGYLAWGYGSACIMSTDIALLDGLPQPMVPAIAPFPDPFEFTPNAIHLASRRLLSVKLTAQFGCAHPWVVPYVRLPPRLTVTTSPGSGATIEATLSDAQYDDIGENQFGLPTDTQVPYWSIESVSANGGDGYFPDQSGIVIHDAAEAEAASITFTNDPGDFSDGDILGPLVSATVNSGGKYFREHADLGVPDEIRYVAPSSGENGGFAVFGRELPTLTLGKISPWPPGPYPGLTLTPTWLEDEDHAGRPYWTITSISFSGNYADARDLMPVYAIAEDFNRPNGQFVVGRLRTRRDSPTLTASVDDQWFGSGATFSVQMEENPPIQGQPTTYRIKAITVTSAGSGYRADSNLRFTVPGDSQVVRPASVQIIVGQYGAVTDTVITYGGEYYKNGPVESVDVTSTQRFWKENPALPPHVSEVALEVLQQSPSAGSGAVLTPVIDTDPESVTFGQLLRVNVENGGSGYRHLGEPRDVGGFLNQEVSLDSSAPFDIWKETCYHARYCGAQYAARFPLDGYWYFFIRKRDRRAVLARIPVGIGNVEAPWFYSDPSGADTMFFQSAGPVDDCENLDVTLTSGGNPDLSVRVAAGGQIAGDQHPLCKACEGAYHIPCGACCIPCKKKKTCGQVPIGDGGQLCSEDGDCTGFYTQCLETDECEDDSEDECHDDVLPRDCEEMSSEGRTATHYPNELCEDNPCNFVCPDMSGCVLYLNGEELAAPPALSAAPSCMYFFLPPAGEIVNPEEVGVKFVVQGGVVVIKTAKYYPSESTFTGLTLECNPLP